MNGFRSFCLMFWLLVAGAAQGEDRCESFTDLDVEALQTFDFESSARAWESLPEDAAYRLAGVEVVRQDVFESQDNWLARLANRYHARTREDVVLSVLPMTEGDVVDDRRLAEAERILRSKAYLYDARVIPRRACGEDLDILVVVRDVWTLEPRLSVERSGSENDLGFGIGDINVAGSGKAVAVGFERDEDRRGLTLDLVDPNIFGTRWSAAAFLVDNDDGERLAASLRYPFFSLDARHALLLSTDQFQRNEDLFFLSDEIWEYRAESRTTRLAAGWSTGLRGRHVNRVLVGFGYEDREFDFPQAFLTRFPDSELPDRKFAYPFIALERIEDDFDTLTNIDRVGRTEDIALGNRLYIELGYSSDSFGADGDHLIGRVRFSDAAWLGKGQLFTVSAGAGGLYDLLDRTSENLNAEAILAYRLAHSSQWSLLVRGAVAVARNATLDQQLLLGGEEGLRGYPNRYQIGDRRFLLTVEERYYSDIYPLRMFRLGGAVFLDVGRAWYEGDVPDWVPEDRAEDHFGVLTDVGFGLRLESTRTRGDRILHLDVAFPLQDGPEIRGVEVTVSVKATL